MKLFLGMLSMMLVLSCYAGPVDSVFQNNKPDIMETIITDYDKDGDGILNADEWRIAYEDKMEKIRNRRKNKVDLNDDGAISDEEKEEYKNHQYEKYHTDDEEKLTSNKGNAYAKAKKFHNMDFSDSEVIAEFDADGDGYLNAHEKVAARKAYRENSFFKKNKQENTDDEEIDTLKQNRKEKFKNRWDSNDDGEVDKKELKNARKHANKNARKKSKGKKSKGKK